MTIAAQSEYIRYKNKSDMIRRWIAMILLRADLESHLTFGRINPVILSGFDTSSLDKENIDEAEFIRSWLKSELDRCGPDRFDEADVFSVNTREIGKSMGLTAVELEIFRFACLMNCYRPLMAASDIECGGYTEADVCDLLAELLRKKFAVMYGALRPAGLLRQSGLIGCKSRWEGSEPLGQWLTIPDMLVREIFREQDEDKPLINAFYQLGPKSTLTRRDFPQVSELALLKKYLRASIKEGAVGSNVLLWGSPGTGKTEMARHIAQTLRKRPLEIRSMDSDNQALKAMDRLDCYRFCQTILAKSKDALVLFDEVEDVLCDGTFSLWGFRSNNTVSKSMINTVLETNKTPSIWITNAVYGIDPAYLRRFDFVINLKTPVAGTKKRMALRAFEGLPTQKGMVDRLVQHDAITAAHMKKVTKICERVGATTAKEVSHITDKVLNGDLKAVSERPLVIKRPLTSSRRAELPYRPDLINCDTDIEHLAKNLRGYSSIRICAFGPPGTGKTAWAKHLAKKVRRPLMVKHAADILDKFVGGTEKNIVAVFKEAAATRSVLMLDEMDSFLPDRTKADKHWEVTQANQFLTAMEEYTGILICSTNLLENLDPATMRRFDFKINFDYLDTEQASEVAFELMKTLRVKLTKECKEQLLAGLSGSKLSHGDFAALLRRYTALRTKPSVELLLKDLRWETSFREKDAPRPIGFLANV